MRRGRVALADFGHCNAPQDTTMTAERRVDQARASRASARFFCATSMLS